MPTFLPQFNIFMRKAWLRWGEMGRSGKLWIHSHPWKSHGAAKLGNYRCICILLKVRHDWLVSRNTGMEVSKVDLIWFWSAFSSCSFFSRLGVLGCPPVESKKLCGVGPLRWGGVKWSGGHLGWLLYSSTVLDFQKGRQEISAQSLSSTEGQFEPSSSFPHMLVLEVWRVYDKKGGNPNVIKYIYKYTSNVSKKKLMSLRLV